MKRLKLGILGILLMFLVSPVFGKDLKLVGFPDGYFKGDTLVNTKTDKIPIDTLLLSLIDFPNWGDFDSFLVYLQMDTVAGRYGGEESDSLGRSALGIYAHPIIQYPVRLHTYGTVLLSDTISGELPLALEDSVLVTGAMAAYGARIRFPQYYIYIKHNSGDTSNVNAQARTVYKGWIGLKKKN